ncbi:PQ-loop repeat-containing protein 1, partial [Armadillidium nasatum]
EQCKMDLISIIASSGIMFGGIVPYIPQYIDIKRTEDAKGFSTYVCLVLLLANTLRFGHWFEIPLLLQSIIMNITMMMLMSLCVSVKNKGQLNPKDHIFFDFDWKYFWKWTDSQSYIEFMLTFTTVASTFLYILIDYPIFVEFIGFFSLSTESMLGLPQFLKNHSSKSTFGMSRKMVLMWLCGDIFKTVYYYIKEVPIAFLIFGCLQILIDFAVLFQCYLYRKQTTNSAH